MSIGKNAIKRVENNGYSHVHSGAPDMENSVIAEAVAEAPAEAAPRKAPRKKEPKLPAPAAEGKDGFVRIPIGGEMPIWLL